jgi:hypothetical protein
LKLVAIVLVSLFVLSGCTQEPDNSRPVAPLSDDAGKECSQMGDTKNILDEIYLECRLAAGNELRWVKLSSTPTVPVQNFLGESIETCQLKDFVNYSPDTYTGGDLGYPAIGEMPSLGNVNVAVVPIDFPDHPQSSSPSYLKEQMEITDDWIAQYSYGKMKYVWQFKNAWIRAPKEAAMYYPAKANIQADGSSQTFGKSKQSKDLMIQQLFEAAEATYDFSKTEYVFFVYPPDIGDKAAEGVDGRDVVVNTKNNSYRLGFQTTGGYAASVGAAWHGWLHGSLHSHGLIGHAPGNEYSYNMMAIDGGAGQSLTAWDTFILQWFEEDQVACFDIKSLDKETVTLTSMDLELGGLKTAMVRLSDHEIIVIESRRKSDPFTRGFPEGFYGVQAYYVNTNHDGQRYDFAPDRETEKKYFSYYLWIDSEDHGTGDPFVHGAPSNLNVVAYAGDSFTYESLKIEFASTGDFDTVVLSTSE